MDDLIYRNYLIEKFSDTGAPAVSEMGKGYDLGIAAALRVVKNATSVNRWIPCSERLPEIYERVLTTVDGYVTENYRCNVKTGELEWAKGFRITHWMPLPEPPKE